MLFPLVGGLLGAPATGFLAVLVATWASRSLAPSLGVRAVWFPVAVAASLIECLLIGQVPYLLGVAFAIGALAALLTGRRGVWIALCAAGCSLSSPLAGLSLGVAVPSIGTLAGRRRALWLRQCMAGLAVSKVVGGADGAYPFAARSLLTVVVFCAMCIVVTRGRMRAVNVFAACYLTVALAAFVVPNPVGGNIVRLGAVIAIPMSVWLVPRAGTGRRRALAVGLVLLAALWPSWSFTSAALRGADDPSQSETYYSGLTEISPAAGTASRASRNPVHARTLGIALCCKAFPDRARMGAAVRPALQRRALPPAHAGALPSLARRQRGDIHRVVAIADRFRRPCGEDPAHHARTPVSHPGMARRALAGVAVTQPSSDDLRRGATRVHGIVIAAIAFSSTPASRSCGSGSSRSGP